MELQQSFSDYYGTDEYVNKTRNETISEKGNFYIHHAIFSFFHQTPVSIKSGSKVLLETCTFFNIKSNTGSGSLYISQSECVIVRICISRSYGSTAMTGYFISSSLVVPYKSYSFECSLSECNGGQSSFKHASGEQIVSNMNSSYHITLSHAGYSFIDQEGTGIMNFTTIANTSTTKLDRNNGGMFNNGHFNITKCNYLNNSYSILYYSLIRTSRETTFSNCSFLRNTAKNLFNPQPKFINCYCNENVIYATVESNARYTFKQNEPLDSLIVHYTTEKCSTKLIIQTLKYDHENFKNFLNNAYKASFVGTINYPSLRNH